MRDTTIHILGAGAFGSALAHVWTHGAAADRPRVRLWCRDRAQAETLQTTGENPRVAACPRLSGIAAGHWNDFTATGPDDVIVLAVKARAQAALHAQLTPHLHPACPVVTVSKGFADDNGMLLGEAVQPGEGLAVLSGPSFAGDLFQNRPTALTLAHKHAGSGLGPDSLLETLSTPLLRLYQSDDPVGVQVCGALKNVIAIACGCADGMALGASARSALMTRGLREIERVIVAYGGDPLTATGLSGFGDLALTCQDAQSRNHRFGFLLGQGRKARDLLAEGTTVEGALTAQSVLTGARTRALDLPICEAVGRLVGDHQAPHALLSQLLARDWAREIG